MIILTAVGPDRPGMAHAVASILADSGCNIEDTTMTRLAGEFAMILIVELAGDTSLAQLQARLAPLESSHGLFLSSREIADEAPIPERETNAPRYIVTAYGAERAGLLARLTGVLSQHNANVTDVQSRVASSGTVYVMIFEVQLPPELAPETLQSALEDAAREIGVTVSMRALEEDTL